MEVRTETKIARARKVQGGHGGRLRRRRAPLVVTTGFRKALDKIASEGLTLGA